MKNNWKNILIWTFVALVVIATTWFVSVPKIQKVINAGKISAELNQELRLHLDYINKLKEAKKKQDILDAQILIWDNLLPALPQQDLFTVMLEDLNAVSDVGQASISFETRSKAVARITLPGGVSAYGFSIGGQGTYAAVLKYLDNLARLSRLVAIERFTLTPTAEEYNFNVQGAMFNLSPSSTNIKITELVFLEKMQEVSDGIIKFNPLPDIESVPLGRDNPFQQ